LPCADRRRRAPLVHSDTGLAGQIGRGSHPDGDQDDIGGNVQVWRSHDAQRTISLLLDAFHRVTARQVDAVATQLLAEYLAEVGIEGGQHCGCHLHDRHIETASGQRVCHLGADVAPTDQYRSPVPVEHHVVKPTSLVDRVQKMHSGELDTRQRRS
jgi:hypothetical protein